MINKNEMVTTVLTLLGKTPCGRVADADTILSDVVSECDYKVSGRVAEILHIWQDSKDKESFEGLFELFTGVPFEEFLERSIKNTTRNEIKLDESHFYTTEDLFNDIVARVEASGEADYSKVVDYALPAEAKSLYDYKFDPWFVLSPGNSEGYYIDLAIHGCCGADDKVETVPLGTIKTLLEGDRAIECMSKIYSACLRAYMIVISDNLDNITRKGYDIKLFLEEDSKSVFGYSGFQNKEEAIKKWETIADKYPFAQVRNNLTRVVEKLAK